jgi:DNA-binding transcriptional MerR regulator
VDEQAIQTQLKQQGATLSEIRDALLGSLDGSKVGLIADHRTLRTEVQALAKANQEQLDQISKHEKEIRDLKNFKGNIMKIIAFCGFAIPMLFELGKGLFVLGWEYLKSLLHK